MIFNVAPRGKSQSQSTPLWKMLAKETCNKMNPTWCYLCPFILANFQSVFQPDVQCRPNAFFWPAVTTDARPPASLPCPCPRRAKPKMESEMAAAAAAKEEWKIAASGEQAGLSTYSHKTRWKLNTEFISSQSLARVHRLFHNFDSSVPRATLQETQGNLWLRLFLDDILPDTQQKVHSTQCIPELRDGRRRHQKGRKRTGKEFTALPKLRVRRVRKSQFESDWANFLLVSLDTTFSYLCLWAMSFIASDITIFSYNLDKTGSQQCTNIRVSTKFSIESTNCIEVGNST